MARDALTQFSEAMIKEASMQKSDIEKAIQQERRKRIDAVKKRLAEERKKRLAEAKNSIADEIKQSLSTNEYNLHKSLVEKRRCVVEEVFDEVIDKLRKFCKTSEYTAYFEKKAAEAMEIFGGNDAVCTVMEEDMPLAERVFNGRSFSLQKADNDFIGGFTIECESMHLFGDYTLLERVADEKERFCENGDLILDK